METTASSLLKSLHFSSTKICSTITNKYYCQAPLTKNHLDSFPSFSFCFPRNYNFPGKCLHISSFTAVRSSTAHDNQNPLEELAVLLEVDGVLVDVYRSGNRQAFNVAFRKLGLDCAKWTAPIYSDLIRKSAGDEERMLILFFNRIGWPTAVPTSEKKAFVKNVLREKKIALDEFLTFKDAPLRPGVGDFIDNAYNERIPIIVLTAYSKSGDSTARSVVEKLGSERILKLKIVGDKEVEQSLYSQLVLGKGFSSGLDEQLANEVRKGVSTQKKRIAEEVASMLRLSVDLDTSSPESLNKVVATLLAGAEYAEKPVCNCILIAGSQSGVASAQQIGMPCVVMQNSLTSRAEFPSGTAIMDGFGGADLTVSKLLHKQWS